MSHSTRLAEAMPSPHHNRNPKLSSFPDGEHICSGMIRERELKLQIALLYDLKCAAYELKVAECEQLKREIFSLREALVEIPRAA